MPRKGKRSRFSIEMTTPWWMYETITEQAFWWFVREQNLESVETVDSGKRHIVVNIRRYRDIKCHGQIQEWDVEGSKTDYCIDLNYEQDLRDFVATVMHELVHLQQYETGEWKGDGEKECERRQYELADEFWEQGLTLNA